MTMPTTQIGEEVRPMTQEEYEQWLADAENAEKDVEQAAQMKAAHTSAIAKLSALGLTEAEINALIGGA